MPGQSKHQTVLDVTNSARLHPPPPPLVRATVNDPNLTEPTPSVAWTRALLACHTVHGTYMWKDMAYCSENQGADNATKSIVPQSASLTQNMNIMHLKTQASDSTHSTQEDQLKNAPPKSTVQNLTELTPGGAWTWALLAKGGMLVLQVLHRGLCHHRGGGVLFCCCHCRHMQ